MRTLNASIGLSALALNNLNDQRKSKDLLKQVRTYFNAQKDLMGNYKSCQKVSKKKLDKNMALELYDLKYEKKTLQLQLLFFSPRGTWQVKGFQFVN